MNDLEKLKQEILSEGIGKGLDEIYEWLRPFFSGLTYRDKTGMRDVLKYQVRDYLRNEGLLGILQFEIRYNTWKDLQAIKLEPDEYEDEVRQRFKLLKPFFAEAAQKYLDATPEVDQRVKLHERLYPFYRSLKINIPCSSQSSET